MSSRDPAKRIPKSIGTETKLFGTYTLADVAVALLPGVLLVLVIQLVLPPGLAIYGYEVKALTLPLVGFAIGVGALFVYLTPSYATSLDWLATFIGFHRSQKELDHEAAKEYTHIERIHPEEGVIERTDGAFLGLVQVEPPTMALATDEEWTQKAESFQDFLNTTVEFPIQIFSTTRTFPVEDYLASYESRLSDPDVKANPRLAALIENYVEWYASDLDERRMTIRDHYVVVPVTPAEVQFDHESLTQKLAQLPVIGVFVQAWFAPRIEEQQAVMSDALDDRLRRISTGLRDIEGCSTRRVEATDAAHLICEFWAGHDLDYGNVAALLRTRPLITGGHQ